MKAKVLNISLLFLVLFSGCISLKNAFEAEVENRIGWHAYNYAGPITETDISGLPIPVQRYFRYCGYLGEEKMTNALISWDDVYLKFDPEKSWKKISCYQFNTVDEPSRFDYMKSHYLGIFPFEASHMYKNKKGNMKIVLMRLFKIMDGKGIEFDRSELTTILSEILFVPSYALQPYVTWYPIDSNTAKATLSYDDKQVSGIFFFNRNGACVRFDTEDRYYSNSDGTFKKLKWSAVIESYQERNCIKYPSQVKAVWHTDKGEYEYFKGRITDIEFNFSNYEQIEPFLCLISSSALTNIKGQRGFNQ